MAWFCETHPLPPGGAERLQALLRRELDDYTREVEAWVARQQVLLPSLSSHEILELDSLGKDFDAIRPRVRARYTDALKGNVPEAAWPAFVRAFRQENVAIYVDKDGKILLDGDTVHKEGGYYTIRLKSAGSGLIEW